MLVVIIGAGGHGHVVADILFHMWKSGRDLEIHGFLDTDPALNGREIMGIPVLGGDDRLPELGHDGCICAIGDNGVRKRVFQAYEHSENLITAIHPSATIAPDVIIGRGSMICAGAIIGPGSTIGDNVIINTGATVDHHNTIGAHAHVAPGVNLGGNVTVGPMSMVGIGASVIPGTTIGERAVVGAGATVIRPVPDGETWVGTPAGKLA